MKGALWFWLPWGIDALITAVVLFFFFMGLVAGSVFSLMGVWLWTLFCLGVVLGGSIWLRAILRNGIAIALLLLLAIPGVLSRALAVAHHVNYSPTQADVRYGKYDRDVLDFFQAKTTAPAPVLIYFHGGGWMAGDKKMGFNPEPMLKLGISCVAANYRFSTGTRDAAPYPAPMVDSARVVQFVRSKAEEWHIDRNRIALTGGSAGAVISMWIAY